MSATSLRIAAILALVVFSVGTPAGQGPAGTAPARDALGPARIGTGSISGTVRDTAAGTPVRRALVTLRGGDLRGGRSTTTNDNGQYTFLALPPGRFTITASKPGYVNAAYGAKRADGPGTPIQLVEGQVLENMAIALPRGGVITGRVTDEYGEPAAGTPVRAFRYVIRTGERVLQAAGQDQADDRGIYRIYQLEPGEYIVNAVPRNRGGGDLRQTLAAELSELAVVEMESAEASGGNFGFFVGGAGPAGMVVERVAVLQQQLAESEQTDSAAYAPIYYPGTSSAAAAATIAVAPGEEHGGIDLRLQLVPTARVTGSVVGATGVLPQGTQVALVPNDWSAGVRGLGMDMTRVDASGAFSFTNVTPGDYTVQARATVREQQGRGGRGGRGPILEALWASTAISISGQDLTDVILNLQPGMKVSGRVVFEGSALPPDGETEINVALNPRGAEAFEMGGIPPVEVDSATGTFAINGVSPGRYTVSAGIGGGRGRGSSAQTGSWTLASALVNGLDALDFPIEVTPYQDISGVTLRFTDRRQQLSGTIQDPSGRPTSDFTIIVFPSDERYWLPQARRIASTRPDTSGRFTFGNLPPGDYALTAITDVAPGEWYDPALLAQLRQVSIPISLNEGESRTQDIRVAGE